MTVEDQIADDFRRLGTLMEESVQAQPSRADRAGPLPAARPPRRRYAIAAAACLAVVVGSVVAIGSGGTDDGQQIETRGSDAGLSVPSPQGWEDGEPSTTEAPAAARAVGELAGADLAGWRTSASDPSAWTAWYTTGTSTGEGKLIVSTGPAVDRTLLHGREVRDVYLPGGSTVDVTVPGASAAFSRRTGPTKSSLAAEADGRVVVLGINGENSGGLNLEDLAAQIIANGLLGR